MIYFLFMDSLIYPNMFDTTKYTFKKVTIIFIPC